jgi:hypothetical protein
VRAKADADRCWHEPRDVLYSARRAFQTSKGHEGDVPTADTIVQDLRYGVRMMRRSPAVAFVATVSLGLGIGGGAAVFGLADALLRRELPVKAPEQLAIFRWSSGPVSVFE